MVTRITPPRPQTAVDLDVRRTDLPPPPPELPPAPPAVSPSITDNQTRVRTVWSSQRTAAEIDAHLPSLSSTQW